MHKASLSLGRAPYVFFCILGQVNQARADEGRQNRGQQQEDPGARAHLPFQRPEGTGQGRLQAVGVAAGLREHQGLWQRPRPAELRFRSLTGRPVLRRRRWRPRLLRQLRAPSEAASGPASGPASGSRRSDAEPGSFPASHRGSSSSSRATLAELRLVSRRERLLSQPSQAGSQVRQGAPFSTPPNRFLEEVCGSPFELWLLVPGCWGFVGRRMVA